MKRDTLSEYLRSTARSAAERTSIRSLANAADIDPTALSRFLTKKGGLTLDTADRLAASLKLRLTKR